MTLTMTYQTTSGLSLTNTPITIQITDLRNPLSVTPADNFQLKTFFKDISGSVTQIDEILSGLTLTASIPFTLSSLSINMYDATGSQSLVVARTKRYIEFRIPYDPLYIANTCQVKITFPVDVKINIGETFLSSIAG
jgi:hypothetical protein